MTTDDRFQVVIAGGGVAALETALALHELADERVSIALLAPEEDFTYRPATVGEPFADGPAKRYPIVELAREVGAELILDGLEWVDAAGQVAHTGQGRELPYDALVIATGGRMRAPFANALTIDDRHMDELLHGIVQDVEGGYVGSIAFVAPERMAWPLPIYELALLTARRAFDMNVEVAITVVTPELTPLAIFGRTASRGVAELLREAGITTIGSARAQLPHAGRIVVDPGGRTLDADRVIALPELFGPAVHGLPLGAHGFLAVDAHGHVHGVAQVFAAGDATDFPVKHGGLAARQADAVAQSIAALAGAPIVAMPFDARIHGLLLTGGKPKYLSAQIIGGVGLDSQISDVPIAGTTAKIAAAHLGPYLERRDRTAALA